MNTFEIEYWDEEDNLLTFYVTVTDYVNVAPQGKWADSDWDCYGYEEVEFSVDSVTITTIDAEGNTISVDKPVDFSEYSDIIEDKLLEQIRELRELRDCHECDNPELEYYDY